MYLLLCTIIITVEYNSPPHHSESSTDSLSNDAEAGSDSDLGFSFEVSNSIVYKWSSHLSL